MCVLGAGGGGGVDLCGCLGDARSGPLSPPVTPDWALLGGLTEGRASRWEANGNSCSKSRFDSRTLTSTCFLKNKQNPFTFHANLL